MKIIDQLKEGKFTCSEEEVVHYLLEHQDELFDLTINELASLTYTSNATVIRVCHKLGFSGYKTMKIALLNEIEANKYISKDVDYSIPFHKQETSEMIVQNIYSLYRDSISLIHSELDIDTLEKIVRCFVSSKRIFIFGIGDAKITAMNFINKLIKINCFPILATEHNEELHIVKNLTSDDCAFFISYSGNYMSYNECTQILNQNNVPIITLTANGNGYLVKRSQYCLCIPNYEKDNKIATFYSQHAFIYILSIIYSLIYKYDTEQKVL